MRVIGTAGHVDHGKSTLVQALTGTHPDRLKEEREREMTIDLGFAFLTLPDGEEVGIVDVPGHRDFIENMLSGVGGIDAALFVVAADEGVMPQTREHLAILDLLQIPAGLVVLTKTDLVQDPDWLELVEDEVRMALSGTVLEDAPILRVSARTGSGVSEVRGALAELLERRPPRPDLGLPRLPVDRVFSLPGFGTIVTGTLVDGSFTVGSPVEILPGGLRGRIRGLQSHNRKEETAGPGTRTAVNISGVDLADVPRGSWVVHPGTYPATRRLDLLFRMLPDASHPLKHNSEVKLFIGAAEVMARARVLGVEAISPGTTGWLQIELVEPVVARRGDRYILRRPSPGETIGGGEVLDPEPARRHKRFSAALINRLEALAAGSPEDVFLEAALAHGAAPLKEIVRTSALDAAVVAEFLPRLFENGRLIALEDGPLAPDSGVQIAHQAFVRRIRSRILQELEEFHRRLPLKPGMVREELRSRLRLPPVTFNALIGRMAAESSIVEGGTLLRMPDHEVSFSVGQQKRVDQLMERFEASPYAPPSVKESIADVGEPVFTALLDLEMLVQVSPDVVFRKSDYLEMVAAVRLLIERSGSLTVADFRDRFGTSRRYALGLLEHLDAIGVTVREGEGRRLRK